jgi:general transcription factor 3C polypeptide 6
MLQLGGIFFRGTHEQLIGTELLFTDGRGASWRRFVWCGAGLDTLHILDESNPSRKFVVPVGTTEQRVKFEQVEVRERSQEREQGDEEGVEQAVSSRGEGWKERGKGKGKGKGRRKNRIETGKSKVGEE